MNDEVINLKRLLVFFWLIPLILIGQAQGQLTKKDEIIKYIIQKPDQIKCGEVFHISFLFILLHDWYIYAPTGTNITQGMIETKVIFLLPEWK